VDFRVILEIETVNFTVRVVTHWQVTTPSKWLVKGLSKWSNFVNAFNAWNGKLLLWVSGLQLNYPARRFCQHGHET